MAAKKGDIVVVHYTGKLDDGSVFDSSKDRDPLEFQIGTGQVIPGFEQAVEGMEKGTKKEVVLAPNDAYGAYNDQLVQKLPRSMFESDLGTMEENSSIIMRTPDGQEVAATLRDIGQENVTVDFNPPLAGKTLHFELELVEIKAAEN